MVKWATGPFTLNSTLEKAEDQSWTPFQTCFVPQEEVIHFNSICQNMPVLCKQEGYDKERIFLIIFYFKASYTSLERLASYCGLFLFLV